MTTAYATAWYGLHDLARIERRRPGADPLRDRRCRAGGDRDRPRRGSRDLRDGGQRRSVDSCCATWASSTSTTRAAPSSPTQIRRDTDGYGVDIVLNSLTGAAQRAGLEAAGLRWALRRDRQTRHLRRHPAGTLPVPAQPHVLRRRPGVDDRRATRSGSDDLLSTVYQLHRGRRAAGAGEHALPARRRRDRDPGDGRAPSTPASSCSTSRARGAAAWWCRRSRHRSSARDGAYIITGGLGGLGLFLAEKMAAAGCGRIVLTSRSQPNAEAQETIERIRAIGADIVVECGDIAEPGTAERLVAAATATGLPVRGVLHAAAVVEDATLTNITDELIERDWAPKVYGAWNLHQADGRPAAGLVLLVLLGGRAGGLAGPGRLRGGQQLAGRLHPLAPRPGPSGHRDRLGSVGARSGRATAFAEERRRRDRSRRGRATRSRRCCATTAPTPATRRSRERRG